MVLLSFEIEIAAPPEKVREVFLDWSKYPEWNPRQIKSIEPVPATKPIADLQAGDRLKVALEGITFSPNLLNNTDEEFKWRGSIPLLFSGDHFFRFKASEKMPGSTRFEHGEDFSGLLSVLMNGSWGTKTGEGFQGFNEDLKKRVEELHQSG